MNAAPMMADTGGLTHDEDGVLRHMLELQSRGGGAGWWPGCGWTWGGHRTTLRTIGRLVRRGLAERAPIYVHPDGHWRLTGRGIEVARPRLAAWNRKLDEIAVRKLG